MSFLAAKSKSNLANRTAEMTFPRRQVSKRPWLKLSDETDERLVGAIVGGDHDAIAILFDRFGRLVFRVAERILHDPGEAEEILQTVFLDIFRSAGKFDPARGSVRIWLLQYAVSPDRSRAISKACAKVSFPEWKAIFPSSVNWFSRRRPYTYACEQPTFVAMVSTV
jgi:Sigma-70 region 2